MARAQSLYLMTQMWTKVSSLVLLNAYGLHSMFHNNDFTIGFSMIPFRAVQVIYTGVLISSSFQHQPDARGFA